MAEAWEAFDPPRALKVLERLVVDEISNWYIRRSRRRFWTSGDEANCAFSTLHEVLGALGALESVPLGLYALSVLIVHPLWL